jgi:hypothetical protein
LLGFPVCNGNVPAEGQNAMSAVTLTAEKAFLLERWHQILNDPDRYAEASDPDPFIIAPEICAEVLSPSNIVAADWKPRALGDGSDWDWASGR